jgi:hypothetical protein
MPEQQLLITLDDLIAEITSSGVSQADACRQLRRELENFQIIVIDPHRAPWAADQVLQWQVKLLESLANWRPGSRPPQMLFGVADYLSHLRYCRIVIPKAPARPGAGRPEQHDWEDAEMYALQVFRQKGDPEKKEDRVEGWKSQTDLAKVVLEYMEKRAAQQNIRPPELNTVRNKIPDWLRKFRALN